MELNVSLKVCEACGCLFYRQSTSCYCRECEETLRDFPTPESRKRRGRPPIKKVAQLSIHQAEM